MFLLLACIGSDNPLLTPDNRPGGVVQSTVHPGCEQPTVQPGSVELSDPDLSQWCGQGYNAVQGDLIVHTEQPDLSALSCLCDVGRELSITGLMSSLEGMTSLRQVGSLRIDMTPSVTTLASLAGVEIERKDQRWEEWQTLMLI